jgi:hypothetical protein
LRKYKPRSAATSRTAAEIRRAFEAHGWSICSRPGTLVARSPELPGSDLSAVELALGLGVDEEQLGGFSRARKRGVGPVASEVLGATDDARPFHGGTLDGERVGVLNIPGDIRRIEAALRARVRMSSRTCPIEESAHASATASPTIRIVRVEMKTARSRRPATANLSV